MDTEVLKGLTEPKMVALARELAMNILPIERMLEGLGLSQRDLDRVQMHPRFIAMVEQMSAEWGATTNTGERVKVKAQALVEDTLPEISHLLHDRRESMAAKIEAMKLLKSLGGLGERDPASVLAPERFHLEIHIGEGKPQVIDITPGPHNLRAIDKAELADFTTALNDHELAGGVS